MTHLTRTFRVFVSSTFNDLKAERNALQENVFPRLRELAVAHGCRFQAIDLRWGVSEEAGLDQQTMAICLSEIARCQKTSPRPNFIVLLGDRYGWRPLPAVIPVHEYKQILTQVSLEDRMLLEGWYRCDENAVPPILRLQPRLGANETYENWEKVEQRLHAILETAARQLDLPPDELLKYTTSATEQEIIAGALRVADAPKHVFCYFRGIEDVPQDRRAKDFIDLDFLETPDASAARMLADLKNRLHNYLPNNIHTYPCHWTENGPSLVHLEQLSEDIYHELGQVILAEVAQLEEVDLLDREVAVHEDFGRERSRSFSGRADILEVIKNYIVSDEHKPMVVWGESGCGKSALMAKSIQQAREAHPQAQLIYRFIGASPESSDGRDLLESLCRQITRAYGADESSIPVEYKNLVQEFPKRLALAGQTKPLLLFLDALDQLSDADNTRSLVWLPGELPGNVKIVVSTLPGGSLQTLERRLPPSNLLKVPPMSAELGQAVLEAWLKEARRILQPAQKKQVMARFNQTGLPLYLKLAFEEARRWNSYDPHPELSSDIPGMIRQLFKRLSLDSNHGEMLVSCGLGYLAAARNGLAEDELLDILSWDHAIYRTFLKTIHHTPTDLVRAIIKYIDTTHSSLTPVTDLNEAEAWFDNRIRLNEVELDKFLSFAAELPEGPRLPVVVWSRLYFDLQPYLVERSAYGIPLLGFFHRQMAEIVREDYLSDDVNLVRHRALAQYFASHKLSLDAEGTKSRNLRMAFELPYQQTMAAMWPELEATLTDIKFIEAKCSVGLTYDLVQDYNRIGLSCLAPKLPLISRDQGRQKPPWMGFMTTDKDAEKLIGAPFSTKLRDFADFVGNQAYILNVHPELTFQQAQLCPQDSAAAMTAEKIGQSSGYHQPWLKRINKTQHRSPRLGTFIGPRQIYACSFSPDGKRIAALSDELFIWDIESAKPLIVIPLVSVSSDCRFSPDSQMIVAPTGESLSVWDVDTGALLTKCEGHSDMVTACAFSPDGKRIVSASWDRTLKVWDVKSGKELFTLRGHKKILFDCDFSPDGKQIVSASYDDLKIWNAHNGMLMTTLTGHTKRISACKFSPDSQQILSASDDFTLKVWDPYRGREIITLSGHQQPVDDCSFSPDGRTVVAVDHHGYIKLWDFRRGSELSTYYGHPGNIVSNFSCAYSPDGKMLISGSSNDAELKLWDVKGLLTHSADKNHQDFVNGCVFSPDGQKVASVSDDKTAKLWDVNSGAQIATLHGHKMGVVVCSFTPDNQRLVTASMDSTLICWDANHGELLSTLRGHTRPVRALAISPGGKRMLSGSDDNTLILWDLANGSKVHQLDFNQETAPGLLLGKGQGNWPFSHYSSDGNYVLVKNGAWLRIQEVCQDKYIAGLVTEGSITTYAWSPLGGILVVGDTLGNVYLLKLEGVDLAAPLVTPWYSSQADSLAFGCPYCYRWSPVSKSMVGSMASCLNCGSLVKLNANSIQADWTKISLALPGSSTQEALVKDEFDLQEFGKYPDGLQISLGNQAVSLKDHGELDDALNIFKEQERICRKNNFDDWLQWSLGNQALILFRRRNLDEAMALYQHQEHLARKLGNMADLQQSLGNQALTLYERGDLCAALPIFKKYGEICRVTGDKYALQYSFGRQGLILYRLGDSDRALALFMERENLCREIGEQNGLYASLCNQGQIYYDRGKYSEALKYYQESENICRQYGNIQGLCILLGNKGEALQALGDLDRALALYQEQERTCREQNDWDGVQWSLGNQASILEIRGDRPGAERLRDEVKKLHL